MYVPDPPTGATVTSASHKPNPDASITTDAVAVGPAISLIVTLAVWIHPYASVTVTS